MKLCDLHSHSHFSDGSLSPTELVALAEKQGLSALALTDHNTTKGLPEFMAAGAQSSVITVPGCEFSTDHLKKELHIVGLFFEQKKWVEVEDFVELMHLAKKHSNKQLIKRLNKEGYDITYEEIAAITDADEFNRAHVARVLCAKGYVKTVDEAFKGMLSEKKGFYVPPKRISSLIAIRFIKANGGTAVFAHPFLNMNYNELVRFLPLAKAAGLDAIETMYSTYDEETTLKAKDLVKRFGLKESGGSDFHGAAKPDIQLGSGRGNLEIPMEIYENLKPESYNE